MKKQKLDLELEVIQISMYVGIIQLLLKSHKELTVTKTIFFSYIIKKQQIDKFKGVYDGRHRRDLILKAISLIEGDFKGFNKSLTFIIKSIDLLIKNKKVLLTNEYLSLREKSSNVTLKESTFIKNAIEESKSKSDIQFWREVIEVV